MITESQWLAMVRGIRTVMAVQAIQMVCILVLALTR